MSSSNGYEEALRRIQKCASTGKKELDLDGLGLGALPEELFELSHLTELSVAENQLSTLPSGIGQLTSLTQLSLWENPINSLPDEMHAFLIWKR